MTLAQIMKLALCQLDEDPADIGDYEELFRMYANDGYHILVTEYYKPVETFRITTDENGHAHLTGLCIDRIVTVKDENGLPVSYERTEDGECIRTAMKDTRLRIVGGVTYPPLEGMTETPRIPEHAHGTLVDYICFRHLSTGNLAKQSRAQAYQNSFYTGARRLRPQGSGSVTRMKNLYSTTDARYRW